MGLDICMIAALRAAIILLKFAGNPVKSEFDGIFFAESFCGTLIFFTFAFPLIIPGNYFKTTKA